jgi:hypothetical protein
MTDQTNEQSEIRTVELDQIKVQMMMQEIKDNQNLLFGIVGGIVAAAMGASIWALITVVADYQMGWMAAGVGFLVGVGVLICGKGMDKTFGVVGAILSLLGCFTGNLLTACIVISRHQNIPFLDLILRLNLEVIIELTAATFNPMDLLSYAIAVYEGYRVSIRKFSKEELVKAFK